VEVELSLHHAFGVVLSGLRVNARRHVSPATLDDHEGDTVGEHEFVTMLSP
jgi:hypothetical protein